MSDRSQPAQPNPHPDAERIRVTRAIHRLTLEDVAAEADTTISALSNIENGHRPLTPNMRQRLMGALAKLIQQGGVPDEGA